MTPVVAFSASGLATVMLRTARIAPMTTAMTRIHHRRLRAMRHPAEYRGQEERIEHALDDVHGEQRAAVFRPDRSEKDPCQGREDQQGCTSEEVDSGADESPRPDGVLHQQDGCSAEDQPQTCAEDRSDAEEQDCCGRLPRRRHRGQHQRRQHSDEERRPEQTAGEPARMLRNRHQRRRRAPTGSLTPLLTGV